MLGFITQLPKALFGLTVLAWGNCLGDMTADVAMTKKGFGEMAMTGTVAGPIFNILVGQGVSQTLHFLSLKDPWNASTRVSLYTTDGLFIKSSILPFSLVIGNLVILGIITLNAIQKKCEITYKYAIVQTLIYIGIIIYLVTYCILNQVTVDAG